MKKIMLCVLGVCSVHMYAGDAQRSNPITIAAKSLQIPRDKATYRQHRSRSNSPRSQYVDMLSSSPSVLSAAYVFAATSQYQDGNSPNYQPY